MRIAAVLLVLIVSLGVAGCGGSPSTPTDARQPAPQPAPPPAPSSTPQLAGIVYDSAERPLSGARVEVLDGPQAGQWTLTDGTGSYGFNGTFDDATRFRATLTGHVPAIGTRGPRCAPCNPNWWLYFFLQPDGASADLTGDYTLTIAADPACSDLPASARARTYTARIAHAVYARHPPETTFKLTVDGASFVSGYGTLDVFVAGSAVTAEVGDLHGAPGLVEQVAETTYLTFGGSISGAVTTPLRITASFNGFIEQCELAEAWGARRNCTSAPTVSRVSSCTSARHQLTLSRQ
jgi:hypothetical protein